MMRTPLFDTGRAGAEGVILAAMRQRINLRARECGRQAAFHSCPVRGKRR